MVDTITVGNDVNLSAMMESRTPLGYKCIQKCYIKAECPPPVTKTAVNQEIAPPAMLSGTEIREKEPDKKEETQG